MKKSYNIKESYELACKGKSISHADVAREMKVTRSYICQVIGGKCEMSVSKLDELANFFGLKLHEFLALRK